MQKSCLEYPVEFVDDAFGENETLAKLLKKISGSKTPRVLIVADMNVVQRTEGLGMKLGKYVTEHGIQLADKPVVVAGGEKLKSDDFESFQSVSRAMLAAKLGKNDIVLALGGGTLLDLAGYAAAQVRGGCKLIRMPTTPAAIFGAACADYASLDSHNVKDAFRIRSVPAAVVIDVSLSASVLDSVWCAGIGEAVRVAIALDATLYKKILKLADEYCARDLRVLGDLAKQVHALRLKKGATDFALWLAWRVEAMCNYKLPAGYSIPIGICVEAYYAAEKGAIKEKDRDTLIDLMMKCNALDGMKHSLHIVTQNDNMMFGLDSMRLATGNGGVPVLTGIGKSEMEENPDREAYKKVLKEVVALVTPH